MSFVTISIIVIGLFVLAWKWLQVRQVTSLTPGYSQRIAIFYLLSGFTVFIGISSVFAEVLFEFLGLQKGIHFEWIGLISYIAFCLASVLIFKVKTDGSDKKVLLTENGDGSLSRSEVQRTDEKVSVNNNGANIGQQNISSLVNNSGSSFTVNPPKND